MVSTPFQPFKNNVGKPPAALKTLGRQLSSLVLKPFQSIYNPQENSRQLSNLQENCRHLSMSDMLIYLPPQSVGKLTVPRNDTHIKKGKRISLTWSSFYPLKIALQKSFFTPYFPHNFRTTSDKADKAVFGISGHELAIFFCRFLL